MRRRPLLQMIAIGVLAGIGVGLVAYFIPWLPEQAATQAEGIDRVYWFVAIICAAIFALVAGVSVYAGWKFRAAPDDTEDGAPIHGHTGLEIVWTVIPTILVTAMSVYSGLVLTRIERIDEDHRVIQVTSQQFAWSFTYPDLELESGELVLAVGEPVRLELSSVDVIHSLWVPEFRMKKDAVPGIHTDLVITPTKTGTYPIICAELCGLGHAKMRSRARVVEREEFERWVREQRQAAEAGAEVAGRELFLAECASCHALEDAGSTAEIGPDLDRVLPGEDAEHVREQIVNPDSEITPGFQPGVMPQDFEDRLTEEQIDGLVRYLLEATGNR